MDFASDVFKHLDFHRISKTAPRGFPFQEIRGPRLSWATRDCSEPRLSFGRPQGAFWHADQPLGRLCSVLDSHSAISAVPLTVSGIHVGTLGLPFHFPLCQLWHSLAWPLPASPPTKLNPSTNPPGQRHLPFPWPTIEGEVMARGGCHPLSRNPKPGTGRTPRGTDQYQKSAYPKYVRKGAPCWGEGTGRTS